MAEPRWSVIAYPGPTQLYDADSFSRSLGVHMPLGVSWGVTKGKGPKGHRLLGVDTPELAPRKTCVLKSSRKPCSHCGPHWKRPLTGLLAEKAKAATAKTSIRAMIADPQFSYLEIVTSNADGHGGLDKYGRILGSWILHYDGKPSVDVGQWLLDHALAVAYDGGTKTCWGERLESI